MGTVRVIVTGIVQGVGFRYFVRECAMELGVKGYARNLPTGGVEIVAEADHNRLNIFIEQVKKGPPHAEVRTVEVEPPHHFYHYEGFSIR